MKKQWTTGKIIGLCAGGFGLAIIFGITFLISAYQLIDTWMQIDIQPEQEQVQEPEFDDVFPAIDWWDQEEYYEFQDDIRDDLSYTVKFQSYEYVSPKNENCVATFTYPKVMGEQVTNLEGINNAIQEELHVVEEYVDDWAGAVSATENYQFEGESYVTYMSEDTLSIIYVEQGYVNEDMSDAYVVSVNIDMETGMIISNTQLLDVDDDFSIEFRKRCEKQNGEFEAISMMSDQEITEFLTNADQLIIFYTPMGMEIGFNFYGGWVTVTYHDYLNYQKQL